MINKNDLINTCLENVFKNNSIEHLRCRGDWPLSGCESIININGNEIKIIKAHESQDRLRFNFVLSLLNAVIKNYDLRLNCNIILSLSDATGLNQKYTRLTFSSDLNSNHILIPDPHLFQYIYAKNEILRGDISFSDKYDKIIFCGSDTGAIDDDLLNQRVKFCNKSTEHEKIFAKITKFVHFNDEMLKDKSVKNIYHDVVPIEEQLKYKFILDIDGNSSSWDRIAWVMASNSYLIHLKSDLCTVNNWYHPYVLKEKILPVFTEQEVLDYKIEYCPKTKEKQKLFSSILLNQETQLEYTKNILEIYNRIYNS